MTSKSAIQLDIVVPCFNEQEVLPTTHERLTSLMERMIDAGQVAPLARSTMSTTAARIRRGTLSARYRTRRMAWSACDCRRNSVIKMRSWQACSAPPGMR